MYVESLVRPYVSKQHYEINLCLIIYSKYTWLIIGSRSHKWIPEINTKNLVICKILQKKFSNLQNITQKFSNLKNITKKFSNLQNITKKFSNDWHFHTILDVVSNFVKRGLYKNFNVSLNLIYFLITWFTT